ncbi:hypothetical protein K466DRAFT_613877 [Polyporus arcularius HHB13444]|uniref:Uncharacterized protein n=1 Tax=Polyporus arcularius HHB13444 TaxID=1314778 RepID=A0A5C3NNB8_9APHY|nr:hypothetical protein K466DRAFT_613877 [Polyporus arcularius HHB13444]
MSHAICKRQDAVVSWLEAKGAGRPARFYPRPGGSSHSRSSSTSSRSESHPGITAWGALDAEHLRSYVQQARGDHRSEHLHADYNEERANIADTLGNPDSSSSLRRRGARVGSYCQSKMPDWRDFERRSWDIRLVSDSAGTSPVLRGSYPHVKDKGKEPDHAYILPDTSPVNTQVYDGDENDGGHIDTPSVSPTPLGDMPTSPPIENTLSTPGKRKRSPSSPDPHTIATCDTPVGERTPSFIRAEGENAPALVPREQHTVSLQDTLRILLQDSAADPMLLQAMLAMAAAVDNMTPHVGGHTSPVRADDDTPDDVDASNLCVNERIDRLHESIRAEALASAAALNERITILAAHVDSLGRIASNSRAHITRLDQYIASMSNELLDLTQQFGRLHTTVVGPHPLLLPEYQNQPFKLYQARTAAARATSSSSSWTPLLQHGPAATPIEPTPGPSSSLQRAHDEHDDADADDDEDVDDEPREYDDDCMSD